MVFGTRTRASGDRLNLEAHLQALRVWNRRPLEVPETKAVAAKGPMKKISDLFTDEEKKQLSYLGSMLRREPTKEEAEQQRILDAWVDARSNAPQKVFEGEEGE
jgi:hypothetical protein